MLAMSFVFASIFKANPLVKCNKNTLKVTLSTLFHIMIDINILSLRKNIHMKTFLGILPSESLHYVKHLKKRVCCC